MLRYAFYLAVALFTFATGWLFVYWLVCPSREIQNSEETLRVHENVMSPPEPKKQSLHEETGIESLTSDKQKALLLFAPTLKKWLNKEKLPENVRPSPEVIERIAEKRLHRYEAPYLTERARRSYKPLLVDFNADGATELVILMVYDESYGSDFWIFRAAKGDFAVILHSREQLEKFELKKTKSNRFFDIQTSYYPNDSQSETFKSMIDYKFNGKEYTLRGCSGIVDRYRDKNGMDLHYLKKSVLEYYDDCC